MSEANDLIDLNDPVPGSSTPQGVSILAAVLPFVVVPRKTYRAIVLEVVNLATDWRCASAIAIDAGLSYKQTIYALHALHNHDRIARSGRTFTARWGPLSLRPQAKDNFLLLTSLFNRSVSK